MSHIINKLLGRDDESENRSQSHNSHGKTEINTSTSTGGSEKNSQRQNGGGGQIIEGRTVQHEGVNIKSTISSDASSSVSMVNQKKLSDLVSKLGSTHTQIDGYAKKQTEKINAEIQSEIDQVVARTRRQQDALLRQANEHTAQMDSDYRVQLQQMVEQIDIDKAKRIAEIEQLLNKQQADILESARNEIDQLNQKAASLKIGVLQQAQAQAASNASEITAQAAQLGQTSTVPQSTGTTTIKTEVSAVATTKDPGSSNAAATTTRAAGSSSTAATTTKDAGSSSATVTTANRQSRESDSAAKTKPVETSRR